MSARVIRRASDVLFSGLEHHNGLYYFNAFTGLGTIPGPPVPIPPGMFPTPMSIHFTMAHADWAFLDDKSNPTVLADGQPIVSKDHAAKVVVHVPPGGNVLVPITTAFSSSTWKLSVSSVVATQGSVAASATDSLFLNVNCADPFSTPTGLGECKGSVHVTPSAGDWAQAGCEWLVQAVFELAVNWGLGKASGGLKNAAARQLKRIHPAFAKEVAERSAREAAEDAVRREGRETLATRLAREGAVEFGPGNQIAKQSQTEFESRLAKEAKTVGDDAARRAGERIDRSFGEKGTDVSHHARGAAEDATRDWFEKQATKKPIAGRDTMAGEKAAKAAERGHGAVDVVIDHLGDPAKYGIGKGQEQAEKAISDWQKPAP